MTLTPYDLWPNKDGVCLLFAFAGRDKYPYDLLLRDLQTRLFWKPQLNTNRLDCFIVYVMP